jgi:hypothetical protein
MDFTKIETWHWFCAFGGLVLLIGIVLYFLPAGRVKVPGVITAAFGALGAGLAAGIIFMAGFGYKPVNPPPPEGSPDESGEPLPMPKMAGIGKGSPKGKGGFGGFGAPPSPRMQLASLVTALDTIVDKPVTVNLSPEDRAAIAKQLEGLDTASEIKDDDAKAKLEAIQKVLEKDRKALETVGYRWATDGKGGAPKGKGGFGKDPPPNPFKEGTAAAQLKALLERLNKK